MFRKTQKHIKRNKKALGTINIKIIDSHSASVGLGLLTMYAVDLKRKGKSYEEIISLVNKKRDKTYIYLVPDDLSYIVKGGRAPLKVKTIANLLRLRPVLGTKKGNLKPRGVLYGKSNTVNKFSTYLVKKLNIEKKYKLMIAHSDCEDKGKRFLNQLLKKQSQ